LFPAASVDEPGIAAEERLSGHGDEVVLPFWCALRGGEDADGPAIIQGIQDEEKVAANGLTEFLSVRNLAGEVQDARLRGGCLGLGRVVLVGIQGMMAFSSEERAGRKDHEQRGEKFLH
jgi:hypothetical protein